ASMTATCARPRAPPPPSASAKLFVDLRSICARDGEGRGAVLVMRSNVSQRLLAPPRPSPRGGGLRPCAAGKLPALGGQRPHQGRLGGGNRAGSGAVTNAADDALQDRGDAEEVVGGIDRKVGAGIEAGTFHIGVHISIERGNAQRREVKPDQRAGAGL